MEPFTFKPTQYTIQKFFNFYHHPNSTHFSYCHIISKKVNLGGLLSQRGKIPCFLMQRFICFKQGVFTSCRRFPSRWALSAPFFLKLIFKCPVRAICNIPWRLEAKSSGNLRTTYQLCLDLFLTWWPNLWSAMVTNGSWKSGASTSHLVIFFTTSPWQWQKSKPKFEVNTVYKNHQKKSHFTKLPLKPLRTCLYIHPLAIL